MKITSIQTFCRDPLSVVRVRTDTEDEGFGQIAPFNADIAPMVMHRQIAPVSRSGRCFYAHVPR